MFPVLAWSFTADFMCLSLRAGHWDRACLAPNGSPGPSHSGWCTQQVFPEFVNLTFLPPLSFRGRRKRNTLWDPGCWHCLFSLSVAQVWVFHWPYVLGSPLSLKENMCYVLFTRQIDKNYISLRFKLITARSLHLNGFWLSFYSSRPNMDRDRTDTLSHCNHKIIAWSN